MQHTRTSAGKRGAMLHLGIHAFASSLNTDDSHLFVIEEGKEQPHGIRAATYRRNQCIRQTPFLLQHLLPRFLADDGLKVPYHRRIGMGACDCAYAVECILYIRHPIAQSVIHSVF